MEPLFEFWAKSGREGAPAPMHSVPHHSLDVAASAVVLLTAYRGSIAGSAKVVSGPPPRTEVRLPRPPLGA
jgi:hypothetical protein